LFDVILFAKNDGEFIDVFACSAFVNVVPVTDAVAVLTDVLACNVPTVAEVLACRIPVYVVPTIEALLVFVEVLIGL